MAEEMMQDKMNRNLILIIALIFVLPIVLALTGVIQTDKFYETATGNSLTGIRTLLYSCTDTDCNSVKSLIFDENSGTSNQIAFEYPYNPSSTSANRDYYAHYFYKSCYLPKAYIEDIWSYGASLNYDYYFDKKNSCNSTINSFTSSESSIDIEERIDFEADIQSALLDVENPPFYIPAGFENYYSADSKATLEILDSSNNIIYANTEEKSIFMDTSEEVNFFWVPTAEGNYTARLTTDVTDCVCLQSVEQVQEIEFEVLSNGIVQEENYTLTFNITDAETGLPLESANILVHNNFNTYSALTNSQGIATAVVEKSLYLYSISLGNYLTFSGVLFAGQDMTINVELVPENQETYTIHFIIVDENNEPIENALVVFGEQSGFTDEEGNVIFEVIEGSYNWAASRSDYEIETGAVSLTENKTITISLKKILIAEENYTVTFIVNDCDTNQSLENATVIFDSLQEYTDYDGKLILEGVVKGIYGWEVLKSSYDSKTGTISVDSDKNVNICLKESVIEEGATNVLLGFPKGGEILKETETILWNATNSLGHILLIRIDYSLDKGLSWSNISDNEVNDGVFNWDTRNYKNDNYVLRVCVNDTLGNKIVCNQSNEFSINNEKDKKNNGGGIVMLGDNSYQPSWDCGSWSDCVDNFQTRLCKNLNDYNGEELERLESRFCEDSIINLSATKLEEKSKFNLLWLTILIGIILLAVLIYLLK